MLFGGLSGVDLQSAWPWGNHLSAWPAQVCDTGRKCHRADITIVPEKDLAILPDTANRKMTCLSRGRARFQWTPVRLRLRPLQWAFS